ncbi:hypothetical protein PpBr36_02407 [Pyricularia pennisetigena]|uniref:hypothetical protein n=1 Tax=Pyricularia pennisetigena TaxID=1578925 RepID=UPI001154B1DC|nr:hypothetical protein PpBr36_02407 [Pyricularia pennisetigena]TLS30240.1 hypothetical protein PpBr36_02407 [Pyricularia pennisetigena]
MQFSTILFTLFATVALAAPTVDSVLEPRQRTRQECTLCHQDCFNSKTGDAAFKSCIATSCNGALRCDITV